MITVRAKASTTERTMKDDRFPTGSSPNLESSDLDDCDPLNAVELLDSDDRTKRTEAMRKLLFTSRRTPGRIAPVTDRLIPLLEEDAPFAGQAAQVLANVAHTNPDAVVPLLSELVPHLSGESPTVRKYVVRAVYTLSQSRPRAITVGVPELISLLEDPRTSERLLVALSLAAIVVERPRELTGHTTVLLEILEHASTSDERRSETMPETARTTQENSETGTEDVGTLRETVAFCIEQLSETDSDEVVPYAEDVEALLGDSSATVRATAIRTLESIVQRYPERIPGSVPRLVEIVTEDDTDVVREEAALSLTRLLESHPQRTMAAISEGVSDVARVLADSTPRRRGIAIGVLSYVAEVEPEAVEPYTKQVIDIAVDASESDATRINAAWTLGYVGTTVARSTLEDLCDDHPNSDVGSACEEILRHCYSASRDSQ